MTHIKDETELVKLESSYLVIKCLEQIAFAWHAATYVPFLIQRGLTEAQTTQVNAYYMASNFLFDIPTGAMADILGKVPIYLWGLLIFAAGTFLYGFGTNFTHFVLCEGTASVGTALMSEALEALLQNKIGVSRFKITHSKEGWYTKLAMIPAALLGGWIGPTYGLQYPWFFSGATLVIALVYGAITLKKYNIKPRSNHHKILDRVKELLVQMKSGTVTVLSKSETRRALFIGSTLEFGTQAINMFWALIFIALSGNREWMGFMFSGVLLTTGFGSKIAEKIPSTPLNLGKTLLAIGVLVILIAAAPSNLYLVIILFLLHEIGRGMLPIILNPYINKFIPNKERATANSAKGSVYRLARTLGLLFAGALTSYTSLMGTWFISGLCITLVGLWSLKYWKE
jgi:MFS family permease